MEFNINKLRLLLKAVEIAYCYSEIEYNKLKLKTKIGEVLTKEDLSQLAYYTDMSEGYSKLKHDLDVCISAEKAKLEK